MRVVYLLLCLFLAVAAGIAQAASDGLIVPGERMGEAALGMTREQIATINAQASCEVEATFDASGRAVRLQTSCGGALRMADGTQVGDTFAWAARALGVWDDAVLDVRYADATAYWFVYRNRGIAFRVLVFPTNATLITTTAVSPKGSLAFRP